MREHRHHGIVIDPVPGVDHHELVRCLDQEDASPAGQLETEQRCIRRKRELLDIRVKPVTVRGIQGPPVVRTQSNALRGSKPRSVSSWAIWLVSAMNERRNASSDSPIRSRTSCAYRTYNTVSSRCRPVLSYSLI